MLQRAAQTNPEWYRLLGNDVRPYHGPPSHGPVVAWQPRAYNFNRAWSGVIRGISFDRSGRMHLQMPILGVVEDGWVLENPVYAWPDNGGNQFYSIDGQPLLLPLTVNPIPGHHADTRASGLDVFIDAFLDLLEER